MTISEIMKTINQRLSEAREMAGYETVRLAAESLGMPYSTYAAHENGTDGFKLDAAIRYSRKFKVSLDWLFTGKGRGPSKEHNLAWELYLQLAEMDEPTLRYIQETIEFTKRRGAAE